MSQDRIVKRIYISTREQSNRGVRNWCSTTRDLLVSLDMEATWDEGTTTALGAKGEWYKLVRDKIHEQQQNEWWTAMQGKPMLMAGYTMLKTELKMETYLQHNEDPRGRMLMTRLRVGNSSLMINAGRWQVHRPPRDQRFCTMCQLRCNAVVEDEKHFLMDCPSYRVERRGLWKEWNEAKERAPGESVTWMGLLKMGRKQTRRNRKPYAKW